MVFLDNASDSFNLHHNMAKLAVNNKSLELALRNVDIQLFISGFHSIRIIVIVFEFKMYANSSQFLRIIFGSFRLDTKGIGREIIEVYVSDKSNFQHHC